MPLTPDVLQHTSKWIPAFSAMWHEEVPIRLHAGGLDEMGAPRMSPEFERWLYGVGRNSEHRARLTQAMRRLRKRSIREYEVAYRIIVLGERIPETTQWLNDRAIRNNKADRYEIADTVAIIQAAVHKLTEWW